jgi:hypothetical protein
MPIPNIAPPIRRSGSRRGHGLGWLMELMIGYPRAEGLQSIRGQVLEDHRAMPSLAKPLCRPYLTHS